MKRTIFLQFLFFLTMGASFGQGITVPAGTDSYHILDRMEITSGIPAPLHSSLKYYQRADLVQYAMQLDTSQGSDLSKLDRADLVYLFKDNNDWLTTPVYPTTLAGKNEGYHQRVYVDSLKRFETIEYTQEEALERRKATPYYYTNPKPLLGIFYKTPAHLAEIDQPFFYLKANPILHLKVAQAQNEPGLLLWNQRGVELRGGIDDRVFFYTQVLESQARFAGYVNERIERDLAVPGAGFYKPYRSSVFNIDDGYDFLLGQGYVGFNVSRHVGLQLGHGRHFIGNGYRSLLLSDFSNNYFYLKLNWRVWRFHFQNLFGELSLSGSRDIPGDGLIPKKYFAAHYLSFSVTPDLTFGLFEAVVFSRNNQFELQYLNPVILYRTVEQMLGSPDNAVFGLEAKWNVFRRFQLYGQLVFDEFKFDELFLDNRKWWGNKYGIQTGIKYMNVLGIDHLDAQAEFNLVRPYTYTHRDSSAIYSHYNQPLAHPLGANFQEYVFRVRYQPLKKWVIDARFLHIQTGEDGPDENWGSNILLPNKTKERDEGVLLGQGIRTDINLLGVELRYALFHNCWVELEYFLRDKKSEDPRLNQRTQYIGGGIRLNLEKRNLDF